MKVKSEVGVIAEAMLEKKASDVVSLDLTGIGTAIADQFVICHADSTTQVSIYQVWGSLKLITGDQTPNLFLIPFFQLKCLLLSSLSPSGTPNRQKVG